MSNEVDPFIVDSLLLGYRPAASVAEKGEAAAALLAKGLSYDEVSCRLGLSRTEVARVLDARAARLRRAAKKVG